MRKTKSQNSSPLNQGKILKFKPIYPLYLTKISSLNQHSMVLIYNIRIKSFSDVEIKNDCSFIDLSLNKLTDFTNFPSYLPELTALILDSNQIVSFNGIQSNPFPKLRFLSLKDNPISQSVHFRLMCLIVFGSQLCSINGEKVNDIQRQNANKLRKLLFPHLVQGKIIANLDPLRFKEASPETEKHKTAPYRKKIQTKSRGTFSSPIYSIDDASKKTALKKRIIEMINDNDIVASPTQHLKHKKFLEENETEEQKINQVKIDQKSREEVKNTNRQEEGKNNKKLFVEKNIQISNEEKKLTKQETENKQEEEDEETTKDENKQDDEEEESTKDENKQEEEDEEVTKNENNQDEDEATNDENKQDDEEELKNDENKLEEEEEATNDENKLEEEEEATNDENKLEEEESKNDENKLEEEEATNDENEQEEESKNDENKLEEEEEATNDENEQEEEEEEAIKDENEQEEEEEEAIKDENKQKEELNNPSSQNADQTAKRIHFNLDNTNSTLDSDQNDQHRLEIDKNITVENEQEKEQDDSKFDIDHYYTFCANNDNFKYTFGNINDS